MLMLKTLSLERPATQGWYVPFATQLNKRNSRRLRMVKASAACSQLAELGKQLQLQTSEKVVLTDPVPQLGRRLVAGEDIEGGEILLSLPLAKAFEITEGGPEEQALPWSLEIALQILEQRSNSEGAGEYRAWLGALPPPQNLSLPITSFRMEDVEACGQAGAIAFVKQIRAMLAQAAEALAATLDEMGASESDLAWAVGLVHSRSFVLSTPNGGVSHVVAPGLDMANHSFEPTAFIRISHSPEACQGQQAVEEVCEAPSSGGGESTVQIVAGTSGIRKGEELTISYGRHSDDIFYAFYGFLPDVNPHNTVELFRDTEDLAAFMEAEEGIPRSVTISSLPPGAANGLVVTGDGFDGRAVEAILLLLSAKEEGEQASVGGRGVGNQRNVNKDSLRLLATRCRQLLDALVDDGAAGQVEVDSSGQSDAIRLSLAVKARKRRLLQELLPKFEALGLS